MMNSNKILTTSAFVLRNGNPEGKQLVAAKAPNCITKRVTIPRKRGNTSILARYLEDERYRVRLQSGGITKDEVKELGRIASGPKREHVLTEAEREH